MAARSRGRRAPLTSSAATMGGRTTSPWRSASCKAGTDRPANSSIQTDVSTTTALTRGVEIDGEFHLSTKRHGFLIGARAPHQAEALDESLRDSFPGHLHGLFEELPGQVCRDASPLRHDRDTNYRHVVRQYATAGV